MTNLAKSAAVTATVGLLGAAVLCGCEVGSPNRLSNTALLNVAGYYTNPGGNVISKNTGAAITSFDLRQNGHSIEAIDNHNIVFHGTIDSDTTTSAALTLKGRTTAGQEGTITGTIQTSGGVGTMRGTWVEASTYGTVYAQATVPVSTNSNGNSTNTPGSLTVSGTASLTTASPTGSYTVSGGTSPYTWSLTTSGIGTLLSSSGATISYKATTNGTQVLKVRDNFSKTGTYSITQTFVVGTNSLTVPALP